MHDIQSENQNRSIQAEVMTIVFDPITFDHLPSDEAKKNLANCDLKDLLTLTDEQEKFYKGTLQKFIFIKGKILSESFPAFNFQKEVAPVHTLASTKRK